MRAQLRSELFKQRSTATNPGLFATLVGLVLFVVLLHGLGLPSDRLTGDSDQLMVLGRGEFLGALFAALLGAMSITGEIRHGTIRPTLLVSPSRGRVVAAKVVASAMAGGAFGLVASALAVGVGSAALAGRGIEMRLDGGDHALLVTGGAAAAALLGVIGVGVGAIVRDQAPTLIGISAWLLFVEGLLGGDFSDVGRFAPGALGMAASGQEPDTLLAPGLGVALLALYAASAALAGARTMIRRDVA